MSGFTSFLTNLSKLLRLIGNSGRKKKVSIHRKGRIKTTNKNKEKAKNLTEAYDFIKEDYVTQDYIEPDRAYVYVLEIKHPVSKDSFSPPILISLYPPESEIFRNALNELTQQEENVTNLSLDSDNMEIILYDILGSFLAKCTLDWENIEWEGETLISNYDNAKMLFIKLPWLRGQVINYIKSLSVSGAKVNIIKYL